jgi:hypothetical protein
MPVAKRLPGGSGAAGRVGPLAESTAGLSPCFDDRAAASASRAVGEPGLN